MRWSPHSIAAADIEGQLTDSTPKGQLCGGGGVVPVPSVISSGASSIAYEKGSRDFLVKEAFHCTHVLMYEHAQYIDA